MGTSKQTGRHREAAKQTDRKISSRASVRKDLLSIMFVHESRNKASTYRPFTPPSLSLTLSLTFSLYLSYSLSLGLTLFLSLCLSHFLSPSLYKSRLLSLYLCLVSFSIDSARRRKRLIEHSNCSFNQEQSLRNTSSTAKRRPYSPLPNLLCSISMDSFSLQQPPTFATLGTSFSHDFWKVHV